MIMYRDSRKSTSIERLLLHARAFRAIALRLIKTKNAYFQTESRKVPSSSQTKELLVGAALRSAPVAVAIVDPLVVLHGVAVAVGVVLIGSGPVILTSPSSPPTRQAKA